MRVEMDPGHAVICAGEASGDLHAAGLVTELSARRPDLRWSGIGGDRLQEAGVRILHHSDQLSFMGFAEVLRHLPYLRRVLHDVRRFLAAERPGLVVLVDYPAFNLRVARTARELGCRVLYYISPQVWAWHEERVAELARWTDRIACVLPFEEEFYTRLGQELGVEPRAVYVGHPLLDTAVPRVDAATLAAEMLLPAGAPLLALLPGSRRQEIRRLLPPMADAVRELHRSRPDLVPVICAAPGVEEGVYRELLSGAGIALAPAVPTAGEYRASDGVHLVRGRTYDILGAARGALVASGTATLEAGLLGCPMVIVYRLNRISWWIGRRRVTVPHIGLVNLVLGRRLVPELLQDGVTGRALADHLEPLLADGELRSGILAELERLRTRLGPPGAAGRTADLAEELLAATVGENGA